MALRYFTVHYVVKYRSHRERIRLGIHHTTVMAASKKEARKEVYKYNWTVFAYKTKEVSK